MMPAFVLLVLMAPFGESLEDKPRNTELQAAIERYHALDFEEVVPLLTMTLEKQDLSPADRTQAMAYLGRAHAALRQKELAVSVFAQLLRVQPDFEVPKRESPLIREAVAAARARVSKPEADETGDGSFQIAEETEAGSADESGWLSELHPSLHVGAAFLLGGPQTTHYEAVGGGGWARLAVGGEGSDELLWPWLGAQLEVGWVAFPVGQKGDGTGSATLLGAGIHLTPFWERGLPGYVDAHVGVARTGSWTQFMADASIGVHFTWGPVHLGPFVQYAHILDAGTAHETGDAQILVAGLGVGPYAAQRQDEPRCLGDADCDRGTCVDGSCRSEEMRTFSITGRVTDSSSGRPVAAAQVTIVANNAVTLAVDPNTGQFTSWPIPAGEGLVKITAHATGYEPFTEVLSRSVEQEIVQVTLNLQRAGEGALGKVRGSLKDGRTAAPISGRVFVPALDRTIQVGATGKFAFSLPPGDYEVLISHRGYITQKKDVHLRAGDVVILNIDLHSKGE